MKITYDSSMLLAGISLYPWTRLGPENWFDDYIILTAHDWDLPAKQKNLELHSAHTTDIHIRKTQQFIETEEFIKIMSKVPVEYKLIPYKPIVAPAWCKNTILQNDPKFTNTYENKVQFRRLFNKLLPFAPHKIIQKSELVSSNDYFVSLMNGQQRVVVQDEVLSGGRGTQIISNYEDYVSLFSSWAYKKGGDSVVVSDYIDNALELSIQCVATKYGTITGPIQQQYVREPLLCLTNIPNTDKFCGGQITSSLVSDDQKSQIVHYARLIGDRMYKDGYKGIFGIDLIMSDNSELFVLEVNARVTGLTPLYNAFGDASTPSFNLLHILELASASYSMLEDHDNPPIQERSLLMYHALIDQVSIINKTPKSGIYSYRHDGLKLISAQPSYYSEHKNHILLQVYPQKDDIMSPGDRLCAVYLPFAAKQPNGKFSANAIQVIKSLQDLFIFTKYI